jgi:hypothetical protein
MVLSTPALAVSPSNASFWTSRRVIIFAVLIALTAALLSVALVVFARRRHRRGVLYDAACRATRQHKRRRVRAVARAGPMNDHLVASPGSPDLRPPACAMAELQTPRALSFASTAAKSDKNSGGGDLEVGDAAHLDAQNTEAYGAVPVNANEYSLATG